MCVCGTRTASKTRSKMQGMKSKNSNKSRVESIYFSAFNKLVESINHQPLNVMYDKIGQRQEVDDMSTIHTARWLAYVHLRYMHLCLRERARVFVLACL